MMAQLKSTFRFKCEANNTNLHIERESDITSDDYGTTYVELSIKNYENNEPELEHKQEVEDKMEHTFVNICDKKFTIKKELLDVTELQQETDSAQHQLESTFGCKHYKVNTTDLDIQRELLINKYEDNELKDIENITIKSEILDIIEQPDEADLQIPRPIKNETDEDENISGVSNASKTSANEDSVVHKNSVYKAIKQEQKDFSVTPLSYWSNGLPFTKDLRVVLEDVMLTLGKQNTQDSFGKANNNDVSCLKAQKKVTGAHLIIKKGKLSNSNYMHTGSANTTKAAKFIYPGLENLHGCPKNTNKKVCARTGTVNSNIDITHYDAESSNNVFICDICNKSYQKKISLYQHIQGHMKLFNCTYCKYSGQTNSNLKKHVNTKHTKVTVYSCSYCSYRTFNSSTLSSHVNSQHTMNTVYNCSHCSYRTYVASTISRHVNREHTKSTVYNCSYCSFSTYIRSTLTSHVNSKHTKSTVYNCSYCDHKTCYKSGLERHINVIHTKINAFYCSYCNYKTYGKNTLAKHINSKHTRNNVLKCGHCSYETHDKNNLCKHIKAKHNNK